MSTMEPGAGKPNQLNLVEDQGASSSQTYRANRSISLEDENVFFTGINARKQAFARLLQSEEFLVAAMNGGDNIKRAHHWAIMGHFAKIDVASHRLH